MPLLPTELILLITTYLPPLDQVTVLQAVRGIARLFSSRQFASTDDNGDTILHLLARARTTPDCPYTTLEIPPFPSILALHEGPILHPQNHAGKTPLMQAASAHNLRFMQLLLQKDPDSLNIVDEHGYTALWWAVHAHFADGLALLLEQPLINVKDRMANYEGIQETPLICALNNGLGPYGICSLLAKHPDTDLSEVNEEDGENPLMLAIRGDQEDLACHFIDCGGFNINATRPYGETALHMAVAYGCTEVIEKLLDQEGIEPDLPDDRGRTPLSKARYSLATEALLSCRDIKVNHIDHDGRSALSHVAAGGYEGAARVLLAHGARPDILDSSGYTPISRAAMAMMPGDMVEILEAALDKPAALPTLCSPTRLISQINPNTYSPILELNSGVTSD
ncbi:ankyrin repeat-containing domain protein [Aspergillus californicus]